MADAPLSGIVVVDLSRMLPGAIMARLLLDLGARVIKVEDPESGDPMRQVPPMVGGVGVGFATLLRGAESVVVDLGSDRGSEVLRALATRADVLVESFRPGRLASWGIGEETLRDLNPGLVWCSLPGWAASGERARLAAHDLNFSATVGALELMAGDGIAGVQLADVGAGLLASTAVLAALLARAASGRGQRIDQPLVSGPLPFVTWAWAEQAAGGAGVLQTLLGGSCPSYRRYPCGDGAEVAVAALEQKFWLHLVEALQLPHLVGAGLSFGEAGAAAAAEIAEVLARQPRSHWLGLAAEMDLPLSAVHDVASARASGELASCGLVEEVDLPGGGRLDVPGPWLPSLVRVDSGPAPQHGEHTEPVLEELGLDILRS